MPHNLGSHWQETQQAKIFHVKSERDEVIKIALAYLENAVMGFISDHLHPIVSEIGAEDLYANLLFKA